MKIVQYLPYSFTIHAWWLEKIAQTISHGLADQFGHKVTDISSDISKWNGLVSKSNVINIYIPSFDLVWWFPFPKIWSKAFWSNISLISQNKPDIIITHTRFFLQSMIGWLIAKYTGAKRVHVEHGSWFVTWYPRYIKAPAYIFDWTIWLRIFRQCDQIITISNMHRAFISKFTSKNPIVIYNPIDFHPQNREETPRSATTPLIREEKIVHIWFVWRLVSLKWVDLLIKVLSKIQNQQYICTIVWTWPEEEKLKILVKKLGLHDQITFVWADDRTNWLHKFDIFVNPSHQEWLPTTVVEALMAKCIVVATDVGGTIEISNQDDLIIVKSNNISDLQKWIKKAIDRLDNSGKSYKIVMDRFGSEKVIKKYEEVLENLVK